ncbi:MAG: NAD(+)/NADH kinase [Chloroflexi bacterium]|nr:NAD(+)/NADH kinase [Chloroflexota bacterium]
MSHIGILYHPTRPDSSALARKTSRLLEERGTQVWWGDADDETALARAAPELNLLITLGGDGTIVRAVRAVATAGVPVLGVNLGRLGFLAEVEPEQLEERIPHVLRGEYHIEERLMLKVELHRGNASLLDTEAINDVVMARGLAVRTVRVAVEVDGRHVMTPTCDGIIVSTPTGSTAYCLAAGGPIVAPDLDCLIITPVAAHLGIAHSLVIPAHRALCLTLMEGRDAMVTVDGQKDVHIEIGDRLAVTASQHVAKFVRFGGDGYFYATVLSRLGWPDRGPAPGRGKCASVSDP